MSLVPFTVLNVTSYVAVLGSVTLLVTGLSGMFITFVSKSDIKNVRSEVYDLKKDIEDVKRDISNLREDMIASNNRIITTLHRLEIKMIKDRKSNHGRIC